MAIDKNIQKKANDIRTKQLGREVRESLASGLEEMSKDVVENESRQTNVEGQWQSVIKATTDKDFNSAPEITASRVGADGSSHANLKQRLDAEQQEVTAQLAQNIVKTGIGMNAYTSGEGLVDETENFKKGIADGAGKLIVLPFGAEYLITETIVIPEGTRLLGYGAKIINKSQEIIIDLEDDTQLIGIEIEGSGTFIMSESAVHVLGSVEKYKQNILIADCNIHDIGAFGLFLEYAEHVRIKSSIIKNIGYAGIQTFSCTDVVVNEKTLIKNVMGNIAIGRAYGVTFSRRGNSNDLSVYPRSKDCYVVDSIVEDVPMWEGLDTHAGENCHFINNTIRNCKIGWAIVSSHLNEDGDFAPLYCTAKGNTIYGIGEGAGGLIAGARRGNETIEYAIGCKDIDNIYIECGEEGNNLQGASRYRDTIGLIATGSFYKDCYCIGVNIYSRNISFKVDDITVIDVQDSIFDKPTGIAIREVDNNGYVGQINAWKVNAALNEFVGRRGLAFYKQDSSISVMVGDVHSNFDEKIFGGIGGHINYGSEGDGNVKSFVGSGTPEGKIPAVVGSLYKRFDGGVGETLYVKETGSGKTGWRPLGKILKGGASSRPISPEIGEMYFDTSSSLKKPIWWNGIDWVDANGTIV